MDSADLKLLRNPFTICPPQAISDTNGRAQDELIYLIHDGSAKELFERAILSTFWCSMEDPYPLLIKNILTNLLPFPTTYLCESGFSTLLQIKTSSSRLINPLLVIPLVEILKFLDFYKFPWIIQKNL